MNVKGLKQFFNLNKLFYDITGLVNLTVSMVLVTEQKSY
jgi:hypothetical protein